MFEDQIFLEQMVNSLYIILSLRYFMKSDAKPLWSLGEVSLQSIFLVDGFTCGFLVIKRLVFPAKFFTQLHSQNEVKWNVP